MLVSFSFTAFSLLIRHKKARPFFKKKDRDKDATRRGDMLAGHFEEKTIIYV